MTFTVDDKDNKLLTEYSIIKDLSHSSLSTVQLVLFPDGERYVRKIYDGNKTQLFNKIKKLNCPLLPQIYHIDYSMNKTTIFEKFIDGCTLQEYIIDKKFEKNKLFKLFWNLLSAVSVLHKNQIIHKDIKPSNIMLDNNGHIYLIDFGISKIYNKNADKDTQYIGTEGYAPPEQYGFSKTDFRSDIYSLGVTINKLIEACGYQCENIRQNPQETFSEPLRFWICCNHI